MTKKVNISEIKENPKNPRVIKGYKFEKLVKSIKDFPKMLELRPIVVNEENIILGGNMRYKAAVEAGLKEVYIVQAKDLSKKQQEEFIIKDNSSFGEWDWDLLANEWEVKELSEWGLDLPKIYFDEDKEPEIDKDIFDQELDTYINAKIKQIVLYLNSEDYEKAINDLEIIRTKDLSKKQQEEFIIKDNSSFGEWDWDLLANEWEVKELSEWGLDLPKIYFDEDKEPEIDKDIFDQELDTYINAKIKQIVLYLNSEDYEKAINDLEIIRTKENLNDNTEVFKFLIDKYGL